MTQADDRTEGADGGALDDRGTGAAEGLAMLRRLRDAGFEGSDEKLAVALGRPVEEVTAWMEGAEPPDDDVIMKARGIATDRNIEIEHDDLS
jgi:hypothetical protein